MPAYTAGEEVWVYFRFEHSGGLRVPGATAESEPYFPVHSVLSALQSPRIGVTDGWLQAEVLAAATDSEEVRVWPRHKLWCNRKGETFDNHAGKRGVAIVPPGQVSKDPPPPPKVSFVCVRWGQWNSPHNTDGEYGGWGAYGTCICDLYIKGFYSTMFERAGPGFEVLTCFVHQSADVRRLSPASVAGQLSAPRTGGKAVGMYFLWPVAWLDGHGGDLSAADLAGYVEREALFGLMQGLESAGVETRHPHPSNLYKVLLSKDWSAHMSTSPHLHVPPTTKVNRAQVLQDPRRAARRVIEALTAIRAAPAKAVKGTATPLGSADGSAADVAPVVTMRGVAKLGYAWEAREVYHFWGEEELAGKLKTLLTQPGSTADSALVQAYIPHDCEVRVYCIHGKPVKMLYTKFQDVSHDGSPTEFRAYTREKAVEAWFSGSSALDQAERMLRDELVPRWVRWLRTESCETPPAIRMDFFIKDNGESPPTVTIGELTEQGASTLGWDLGPVVTFNAVIDAILAGDESQEPVQPGKKRRRTKDGLQN
eukprot:TRINITY_DN32511_c0_g1_i1.p1 TRINITY_DN32511_c0_g1~~TRINITY_DN32511_c0_g1_i1.p1  ORF type:complete len:538 (+),score=175.20 TRINITY_DN32511_c0_g1_i1:68-1681(+)